VPLVTCIGRTFAGRVASSLLQAAGLSELVATSLEEYERLAAGLAGDKNRLSSLRNKLVENLAARSPFNTRSFTRTIESAYESMWQMHQAGRRPEHILLKRRDQQSP